MNHSEAISHSIEILLWMTVPIVAGFAGWHLWLKRRSGGEGVAAKTARALGKIAILGAGMPMMLLIFWRAELPLGTALLLPMVGLFGHLIGGLAGWGIAAQFDTVTPPDLIGFAVSLIVMVSVTLLTQKIDPPRPITDDRGNIVELKNRVAFIGRHE